MPKDEPTAVTQEGLLSLADELVGIVTAATLHGSHEVVMTLDRVYEIAVAVRLAAEAKASIVPDAAMVEVVALRHELCELIEAYCPNFDGDTGIAVGSEVEQLAGILLTALSPYFDKARREGIERAAKVAENLDVSGYRMGHGQAEIATAILALPSGPDDGAPLRVQDRP